MKDINNIINTHSTKSFNIQHSTFNISGFTLIELTIVLIVIGLLLGIVMKGADVLRSANMKKDYANYIDRLYGDIFKYKSWTLARLGYENIIGDGQENGGFDQSTDGFIDTDTDNDDKSVTVGTKWFSDTPIEDGGFSQVRILTNYDPDDPKSPYKDDLPTYLSGEEVDPDIDTVFQTGNGQEGFMFHTRGSKYNKMVHIYLGADKNGDNTANFMIIHDLPLDEAISFDTLIEGSSNGEKSKFIALGYRVNSQCYKNVSSDTCQCSDTTYTCIGKGAEGGCALPACSPEQVELLVMGYSLKD